MKTVLGISGPISAGKDVAAAYLSAKLGIPAFQTSQPLKDEAERRGIEPTRWNLITLGSTLAKEKGEGYLGKLLLEKIDAAGIISGIRQLDQVEFLRHETHFFYIGIDAPAQIRFDRAQLRNKLGEQRTLENFLLAEQAENEPPNIQRLFDCMKLVDYTIQNVGSLEDFYLKLDALIALLRTNHILP